MDQPALESNLKPESPVTLSKEVRQLRTYLVVTLTACVVVAFCFNAFLYRYDRFYRGQNAQARELEVTTGTSLGSFLGQLVTYSGTHPDVLPLLAKYGVRPGTNAPAVSPAPGFLPATGTAPKAVAPAGSTAPKK